MFAEVYLVAVAMEYFRDVAGCAITVVFDLVGQCAALLCLGHASVKKYYSKAEDPVVKTADTAGKHCLVDGYAKVVGFEVGVVHEGMIAEGWDKAGPN